MGMHQHLMGISPALGVQVCVCVCVCVCMCVCMCVASCIGHVSEWFEGNSYFNPVDGKRINDIAIIITH
jgi:hypothetical protein